MLTTTPFTTTPFTTTPFTTTPFTTTQAIRKFIHQRSLFSASLLFGALLLGGCEQQAQTTATTAEPAAPAVTESAEPIAATQYGKVRGFVENGITVFKGIRYGANTAETRFQAPKAPEPWAGVADTLAYGNSAPQVPTGSGGGLFASWKPDPEPALDEDCLFLNVWTPALRDGKDRPVLVWFHGGGFTSGNGSSNAYDGVRLAQRGDVVVVTVNHRLNTFGYMYLGQFGEQFADSGNAGMLDLVQSLRWVRDNIREFGGNPDNVLIFGESGGGAKVSTLLAMDDAKGLFHRAVIQSGPAITSTEVADAETASAAVVAKLGLTAETIGQILTLPVADIEAAARAVTAEQQLAAGRGPVVDGRALKRHPFAEGAPPQSADVPVLIGTTRTENSLLIGSRNPSTYDLTFETLPAALQPYATGLDVNRIIAAYRELDPALSAPELFFTATTDAGFLNRSVELADKKAAQKGEPVYMYLLNWNTPVEGGKWMSPHALEIGMVFDNVAKSESMSGIGPEQQLIADQMSEAWLAFAKTGNPNHAGLPQWPAFSGSERPVMIFDVTPQVVNDPRGKQRKLFLANEG